MCLVYVNYAFFFPINSDDPANKSLLDFYQYMYVLSLICLALVLCEAISNGRRVQAIN